MSLRNRVALVTGGSRGIGRGIALRLAQEGARIAFAYRVNKAAAQAALRRMQTLGTDCVAVETDITEPGRAEHTLQAQRSEDPPVRRISRIHLLDEPGVLGARRVGQELALDEHRLARDPGDAGEKMHRILEVVHDAGVDREVERADVLVQVLAIPDLEVHVDCRDLPDQACLIDPVDAPVHAHDSLGASKLRHQRKEAAVAAHVEHGLAAEVGGKSMTVPQRQRAEAIRRAARLEAFPGRILDANALQIATGSHVRDQSRVLRELVRGQAAVEPKTVCFDSSRHRVIPLVVRVLATQVGLADVGILQ